MTHRDLQGYVGSPERWEERDDQEIAEALSPDRSDTPLPGIPATSPRRSPTQVASPGDNRLSGELYPLHCPLCGSPFRSLGMLSDHLRGQC